jgi:hypothetical protein
MREYPWSERRPSAEHYQNFRNLADFHALTLAWLSDLEIEPDGTHLKRVMGPLTSEDIWMLGSLVENTLPSQLDKILVDESTPEDLLKKLRQTVWGAQAWALKNVLERTPREEQPALRNLLEQSSWKAGRRCALARWAHLDPNQARDLGHVFACLQDSPFSGYPQGPGFLVRRQVSSEIETEMLLCPHRSPSTEVQPMADLLCMLHVHWIRGYAYGLNPFVMITYRTGSRCILRWAFHKIQ